MNKKFLSLFVAFTALLTSTAGNAAAFKAALDRVDKGGEYLTVTSSLEASHRWTELLTSLPPDKKNMANIFMVRLQKVLGTLLVKAQASSSIEAAPGCWVFKNYQYIGKENMQLPSLFRLLNVPDKKLNFAELPADTVFALSGNFDVAGMYQLLHKEFTSQEDMFKMIFMQMPVHAQQRGIDLEAMFSSISGNWTIMVAGTNPGDLLINVEIPDKDGLLAAFIRKELKLPANSKEAGLPFFFLPAKVTFAENVVKLSTAPTTRKAIGTLADNPDFTNYTANIGDTGSAYSLINITPQLIAMIKSFIPQQIAPAIPLAPFSALGLLKYDLAGAYSVAAANVSGTKMVTVCTTSVLSSILLPALNQARERARVSVCISNLKNIAIALVMYNADYKKTPAPNGIAGLQMLVDSEYLDIKCLTCASKPVQYQNKKLTSACPYIYIGGIVSGDLAKVQKPSQLPLAFEKPNHKQHCPVMFADGHVELLTIKPAYTNPNQVVGELSKRYNYEPGLMDKMLRAIMEN